MEEDEAFRRSTTVDKLKLRYLRYCRAIWPRFVLIFLYTEHCCVLKICRDCQWQASRHESSCCATRQASDIIVAKSNIAGQNVRDSQSTKAATANLLQPCKTVPDLITAQAQRSPTYPAVGFAAPNLEQGGQWTDTIYTFADIERGSRHVASRLLENHGSELSKHRTVGMLCPSTEKFLFTWLALMRLGHAVLLIAPQCQPAAIASLCRTCEASCLLYDDVYQEHAEHSERISWEVGGLQLTAVSLAFLEGPKRTAFVPEEDPKNSVFSSSMWSSPVQTDVAYIHHTSGTSSGMPKPIPQSHRAAVGVLPCFPDGHQSATFTTTPLYHGGVADLFRAWTSGAMVWLFPGRKVPITASNIIQLLSVARRAEQIESQPSVRYFSSVPYVLQSMAADDRGLQLLRSMDIVGVGGAALPTEVGDRLVKNGVKLISRFGSAECGFLMSSHRDFDSDPEWQYLRQHLESQLLNFELQPDGTSELVVGKDWPHMAKTNRENGSYATSDLFAKHETIQGAWRYHSRADSQLTLITGKKFDPAPLEDAISTLEVLDDTLIFGNGRQSPGVLLFRSSLASEVSDTELLNTVWPTIERLNLESQDHARISRDAVVPVAPLKIPLEKSSKGTIIRNAAEARFSSLIEATYDKMEEVEQIDVPDSELLTAIKEIVEMTIAKQGTLGETTDLFAFGVDSIASMRIRQKLRSFLPPHLGPLPIDVVEDCGSVRALQEFILRRRHGQAGPEDIAAETVHQQMHDLVQKYSVFNAPGNISSDGRLVEEKKKDVVVLTGATGALGAHILNQYRQRDDVERIYCLVRGADNLAAYERVTKALTYRKLQGLSNNLGEDKIVVLPAQLGDAQLGLEQEVYDQLARETTIVMHVAWSVNFRMKLMSFAKDNIAGVNNLINLALKSPNSVPPRFAFCSSVASVVAFEGGLIPEEIINDPGAATPLGYSQSKWVAEQICSTASTKTRLRGRMTIYRVGQLAGDTVHGIWNMKEAWPLMLSTVKETGCLPMLHGEPLTWLPVDVAASALIQGVRACDNDDIRIFHVVNEHQQPSWEDLLKWLAKSADFRTVSTDDWIHELERFAEKSPNHPALQLLDHWKTAYGDLSITDETCSMEKSNDAHKASKRPRFSMMQTERLITALRGLAPVEETYVHKLWEWIRENTYKE
nr:non-canonical non-ribosomal peptide synthetase fub8 [Quercus suber]